MNVHAPIIECPGAETVSGILNTHLVVDVGGGVPRKQHTRGPAVIHVRREPTRAGEEDPRARPVLPETDVVQEPVRAAAGGVCPHPQGDWKPNILAADLGTWS